MAQIEKEKLKRIEIEKFPKLIQGPQAIDTKDSKQMNWDKYVHISISFILKS